MTPIMRQILLNGGIVKRGLVAWYDFQQGADADILYDKSGYGNHGRLGSAVGVDTNDPAWSAQSLAFDRDDLVTCGNGADVSITGAFTLMSVQNASTSFQTHPRLINKEAAYGMYLQTKDGLIYNMAFLGNIGGVSFDDILCPPGVIIPGIIQMTTITYNGSRIIPYVNGKRIALGLEASGDVATIANTLSIGNRADVKRGLAGNMYYALIYNTALTDKEIASNCTAIKKQLRERGVMLP